MTPDLKRLRSLAKAASPGPWHVGHMSETDQFGLADLDDVDHCNIGQINFTKDQAYLCAVSPDVVLALLDRIEKLEIALKYYAGGMGSYFICHINPNSDFHKPYQEIVAIARAALKEEQNE
jgi:hypothetical protein